MGRYLSMVMLYHGITYGLILFVVVPITTLCMLVSPLFAVGGIGMSVMFIIFRHGPNLTACKRRWRLKYDEATASLIKELTRCLQSVVRAAGH